MAFKIALVLLVALAAVASARIHKGFKRPNYDNIDYYDCTGKADGNYVHPTDCTRFIMCTNQRAADMACADCDMNNVSGCAGSPYLFWDQDKNRCEWPRDTYCGVRETEEPPTDPPTTTTTTTTTEAPTEEPTEEPTEAPTEAPTTEAPTTEAPTTEAPTTEAPQVCNGMKAGDSCDKDSCEHCGYCWDTHSHYFRCQRTFPSDPKLPITGVIVHESCDADLWWNPDIKPSGASQGGACDHWDNLSQAVKDGYTSDPNCVTIPLVCEWGQDENQICSKDYWYFDPETMTDREHQSCSDGLYWDPKSETCRHCSHVVNLDGSGCTC